MVSSKTKYLRRVMLDRLYDLLPEPDSEPEEDPGLKVAIIGKRNAGKSTLVNALAGEERVIVSEIAGTTRDAIDVRFELDGKRMTAIDTAGLRRKKSFQDEIEWYAFDRAQRAIERADVVLLLIDATEKISQVDEQLAALVEKSFKPVVLVVNKWDLAKGQRNTKGREVSTEDYDEYLRKEIKGLRFAPIAFVSAKTKSNLRPMMELAMEIHAQASERVSTGKLNRILGEILGERGPGGYLGSRAKIYFASQVKTNPPTVVLIVNRPEMFTHNDERYLMNRLREALPFEEVPIRLILRARSQAEASLRKAGRKGSFSKALTEIDPETQQFVEELDDVESILADLPDDPEAYFDDDEEM